MKFFWQVHLSVASALFLVAAVTMPSPAQPGNVENNRAAQNLSLKTASGSPDTVTAAIKFYDSGQYDQARQLLEQSMQSGRYDAHVCYYAALANRKCGAEPRAGKLFEYVVQNFPDSNEAKLFQQANPTIATKRVALVASSVIKGKTEIGQHPFTAADIAKDGYDGVTQGKAPNCWFESSLAAIAALPKGQIMIANLIRTAPGDSYVVDFCDGSQYTVTQAELKPMRDRALWAKIIECAERKKWPKDEPLGSRYDSFGDAGMGIITGRRSEAKNPGEMSVEEINKFIYAPIKSQNPVIACTKGEDTPGIKDTLVPGHVYSIIGFEPNKNMIVLRNPWGGNPKNLKLENDPQHMIFEEQKGGVIKISVEHFQKYFRGLRRSYI